LARRQRVSKVIEVLAIASAMTAIAVLAIVIYTVVKNGAGAISWSFLTTDPRFPGGGVASAIVGTVAIVAVATVLATPLGVMTAIYLTEFAGTGSWLGRLLTRSLNLMQSLPTIVVGVFVFGLLVQGGGNSGFAGSVALAIVMLPLIARSSQEVLLRVPGEMREAGDALGVDRWRTILTVVLPTASGGILTGTILAVARAAGETAPLLVCDSLFNASKTSVNVFSAIPNIPVTIFSLTNSPNPSDITKAWGLALVLLTVILVANVGARILLARSRRKTGT
ncbi:MAG: phosphate ABC transporter permease PstA, partial [Solirubrobacteraceae bacterium]